MGTIEARALTAKEVSYIELINDTQKKENYRYKVVGLLAILNQITADESLSIRESVFLIKGITDLFE